MRCFLRLSENILLPWTRRRCLQASRKVGQPAFSALPCGGPACQRVLETSFRPPWKSALTRRWAWPLQGRDGSHCCLVFLLPLPSPHQILFVLCPPPPVAPLLPRINPTPLSYTAASTHPWNTIFPMLAPYLSTPVSPVSLLLLKHARHICTPGPLHLLIPLIPCSLT